MKSQLLGDLPIGSLLIDISDVLEYRDNILKNFSGLYYNYGWVLADTKQHSTLLRTGKSRMLTVPVHNIHPKEGDTKVNLQYTKLGTLPANAGIYTELSRRIYSSLSPLLRSKLITEHIDIKTEDQITELSTQLRLLRYGEALSLNIPTITGMDEAGKSFTWTELANVIIESAEKLLNYQFKNDKKYRKKLHYVVKNNEIKFSNMDLEWYYAKLGTIFIALSAYTEGEFRYEEYLIDSLSSKNVFLEQFIDDGVSKTALSNKIEYITLLNTVLKSIDDYRSSSYVINLSPETPVFKWDLGYTLFAPFTEE